MRFVSFFAGDGVHLGVETESGVVADLTEAGGDGVPGSARELVAGGRDALERVRARLAAGAPTLPLDGLEPAPCVPEPPKIICVGLNYRRHAEESGIPVPEHPVYFPKYRNGLAGHGAKVAIPEATSQVDYEVELVAVMGGPVRNVTAARALDHVFGYATGNDLSARELQMRSSQWTYGKALDGFAPLGPYLVTADEVPDPQDLDLRTWVNGELRQKSSTRDMVFSVAELVADLSRVMTLEPGDLIYTGTPEGVVLGMEEKVWLKAGDQVVCEVGGLGRLETTLVDR
ncbi:fumarylacetoacetate hydrolase family protein [Actinomadura sp. SCN-SB]|uniref:fumarylacetoacetate hydrolase family protein n=1 Tax=Actinomadura sp. SCN-SB TaxID=3373092 RepID=UPI003753C594